jgi:hypothetical protein
MTYTAKVVLHAPRPDSQALQEFVEACIRDQVVLVCVVGEQCELVADTIDELVVGSGLEETQHITTTSHPNEELVAVIAFANEWSPPECECQEVWLLDKTAAILRGFDQNT